MDKETGSIKETSNSLWKCYNNDLFPHCHNYASKKFISLVTWQIVKINSMQALNLIKAR